LRVAHCNARLWKDGNVSDRLIGDRCRRLGIPEGVIEAIEPELISRRSTRDVTGYNGSTTPLPSMPRLAEMFEYKDFRIDPNTILKFTL
jgi:hypothetical protein